jgi:glycosyltransferase involved in cell wall biosynthesis
MKVLHVIPSIAAVHGGPSQAVLAMVGAVRVSGVDAKILTTNDNGSELLNVPLNQWIEYEQVPVWFVSRSLPLKEFIFSFDLTFWLWEHIQDYDLLHNHYLFSYAPTCAGAIARQQKIPYLVSPIGQLTPWALTQSWLKKKVYTALIEQRNLNCAAAIHCTSEQEVKDASNFGIKTTSFVMPLAVNEITPNLTAKKQLHEKYKISVDIPIVLFLARLHYVKRPDLLLQSLSQLAIQNQPFHLILAGSGEPEYVAELHRLVTRLNLTNQTSFVGFVNGEEKNLLLQGSDLFVLPSFSENFGLAIAEAMAAGLPVIVTPGVQIATEIAQANAGLVITGEVDPLSQAIAQLLINPSLRQQLGFNGQRLAQERYSYHAIGENLKSIYHNILSQKSSL